LKTLDDYLGYSIVTSMLIMMWLWWITEWSKGRRSIVV